MNHTGYTASNPDLNDRWGNIEPPTAEQTDRARRVVAGMACDAEEAKVLLSMLGIGSA